MRCVRHLGYLVLVAPLVLVPQLVSAQSTGSIAGAVTDATGALLPGVTVRSRQSRLD
jgi:hypothetical protein